MRLTPQVIADLYPSLSERLQGDLGRDAAFDLYLAFLEPSRKRGGGGWLRVPE